MWQLGLLVVLGSTNAAPLSANDVLKRSQKAYDSARTLIEDVRGSTGSFSGTAHIVFQRPGQLKVSGASLGGRPYALLVTGGKTWVLSVGQWQQSQSPEMGIAAITGISANAGTSVPAALFHAKWGGILTMPGAGAPSLTKQTIAGRSTYVVHRKASNGGTAMDSTMWFDSKTFFLVQTSMKIMGRDLIVKFDAPKINVAVPKNAFTR
ncbi:MAG TPA: hypothetical protein VKT78_10455 [Fimbriimonadaceae bacterium]|nr:hypothetical protein [Fimbriimonadaceae bacterium]